MQLVLLAGGKGSRLSSVSCGLPKGMIEVAQKPFIYWLLKSTLTSSISNIHFCLGFGADLYLEYLTDLHHQFKYTFTYSTEDVSRPLGTAGALVNSEEYLDGNFIVQYADTVLSIDYDKFFAYHLNTKHPISMSMIRSSSTDITPNIARIEEPGSPPAYYYNKEAPLPSSSFVDYGALCLSKDYLMHLEHLGPDLSAIQEYASRSFDCGFFEVENPFIEIGTPESLLKAQEHFR